MTTERVNEAAGIELPDRPGVWFRDGAAWLVRSPPIQDVMFAVEIGGYGYTGTTVCVADLPRGNWHPAVPASALAERDAEVERLRTERDASKPAEEPNPGHEELAAKFRAASREGDGKPEGTLESLERCARMLDTYAPECFPANDKGQVSFSRAMMESTADEIRAYLASDQKAEIERLKARIECLERPGAVRIGEQA